MVALYKSSAVRKLSSVGLPKVIVSKRLSSLSFFNEFCLMLSKKKKKKKLSGAEYFQYC